VHLLEDSPYRAVHEAAGFLERSDLGRLRLRGADRASYLHGILTNDILALSAGDGCYAALLTPQGRMITDMHVYHLGEETLLTLPRSLAGQIRDRLDQFIFSEDVTVEDATGETVQYGVYGPSAAGVTGGLSLTPTVTVLRSADLGVGGFEVVARASQREEVERALGAAGAVRIDPATAEVCRVEAGIPKFLVDITADTIPLEAGIEDRAISMTKGCYPGQEVIVRVLHRGGGRVAKKLVGFVLPAGASLPAAGEKVTAADAARAIGAITSAVDSPLLGRPIALGYVHRDFAAPGTAVRLGERPSVVAALPFHASASADFAP
jgi:folate-binding protein YgfZ